MKLTKVKCCKDDSGHWYVIPNDIAVDFYKELNHIIKTESDELCALFDAKYGAYMTGGDPVEVNMRLIDILWAAFGGTYTNGFKLLIPQVRLIQGDGIDIEMIEKILSAAKAKGYCADNWVFGSGGGLLQKFDRDTQNFAIKASYGERIVNGNIEFFNLVKEPITSKGKRSKAGKLKLQKGVNQYLTLSSAKETDVQFNSYVDYMDVVFDNGKLVREQTFDEIKKIIEKEFI